MAELGALAGVSPGHSQNGSRTAFSRGDLTTGGGSASELPPETVGALPVAV